MDEEYGDLPDVTITLNSGKVVSFDILGSAETEKDVFINGSGQVVHRKTRTILLDSEGNAFSSGNKIRVKNLKIENDNTPSQEGRSSSSSGMTSRVAQKALGVRRGSPSRVVDSRAAVRDGVFLKPVNPNQKIQK